MRVVITGASGNVGTSLVEALGADPAVEEIVGVARRRPDCVRRKTVWVGADVAESDLEPIFAGADCVVHLAWLIQPGRDQRLMDRVNVDGSRRVFEAVAAAGVPSLVYASSVGAYSPGPKDRRVDESWPTDGVRSAYYGRQKAAVERLLDGFESDSPSTRVVRLRPGLIFKRDAASGIRRLFVGPLLPNALVRRSLIAVLPDTQRLAFQAVHSHDVGEAFRLAVAGDARGAFNVAAEPVLDVDALAAALDARPVPVDARVLRAAALATWKLRLQPTDPAWLDMGLGVPLMDTTRVRTELGWEPRQGADEALLDLLGGIRDGAGYPTPPLAPGTGGPLRMRELLTGVGSRE